MTNLFDRARTFWAGLSTSRKAALVFGAIFALMLLEGFGEWLFS